MPDNFIYPVVAKLTYENYFFAPIIFNLNYKRDFELAAYKKKVTHHE